MSYRQYWLGISVMFLTGCMSPVKLPPETTYVLNQTPTPVIKKNRHAGNLLVLMPETNPIYNTTQIAYSVAPHQIAYYGLNHWAAPPAQMIQPMIAQAIQNTHAYKAVLTPPFIGNYQYLLSTRIAKLQIDFTHQPAILALSVHAELSKNTTGSIIKTRDINIVEPLSQNTPYGGVLAANRAVSKMLGELTVFAINF